MWDVVAVRAIGMRAETPDPSSRIVDDARRTWSGWVGERRYFAKRGVIDQRTV